MPIVCRFIVSQDIVNVCQFFITRGELIKRAVAEGIATEDQLEEIELTPEEFKTAMDAYAVSHPPAPDPLLPLIRSFAQKMIALGITKNELKAVFAYLRNKLD